jgi:hypothetical protein
MATNKPPKIRNLPTTPRNLTTTTPEPHNHHPDRSGPVQTDSDWSGPVRTGPRGLSGKFGAGAREVPSALSCEKPGPVPKR